ncbi:MAG: phosphatase PAP2 family protein [Dehalococcoidia bacterium]|nr:phosphatase PAP2 family protein [Dehalococcoidia bacterium]
MTVRQMPISRPLITFRAPARFGWVAPFGRDFGIVLAVIGAYFLLRGLAPTRIDLSLQVTAFIVELERSLYLFWEPEIQSVSIQSHAVQEVANFVYAYLHFPVLALVGGWLWFRGRERFLFMRDVMFVSMVIGIVFYYAVPAAPPRLMAAHGQDLGFVDTVFGGNTSVQYAQPSFILNEYAAIPSFHFGWIALASAAVWINTSNRALRALAVLLSVLMTWAIVASANHFFFDMVLGGIVILAAWQVAKRIERWRSLRSTTPLVLPAAMPRAA